MTLRLKNILEIPDQAGRMKALLDCAKSLNIDIIKARDENGEFNEQELSLLIYDAEQAQRKWETKSLSVIVTSIFMVFVITVIIILVVKGVILPNYQRQNQQFDNPFHEGVTEWYDDGGKIIGRAVYEEGVLKTISYYQDGRLQFMDEFKEGARMSRRVYDEDGSVVRQILY